MLKTYKMYRIFDLLFFSKEEAEKLEDGKDFAKESFVVSSEKPENGEYIEPNYSIYNTEEEANDFAKSENAYETENEIAHFMNHVEKSIYQMLDERETNSEYDEKYDLKISFNGETLSLPLHADLYERLTILLKEEVEENRL